MSYESKTTKVSKNIMGQMTVSAKTLSGIFTAFKWPYFMFLKSFVIKRYTKKLFITIE